MKLKLLILLTLASLGVSAQSWVNFGANGIQRKVNGTDTVFRWNGGASGYLYGRSEAYYKTNLVQLNPSSPQSGSISLQDGMLSIDRTGQGNYSFDGSKWNNYLGSEINLSGSIFYKSNSNQEFYTNGNVKVMSLVSGKLNLDYTPTTDATPVNILTWDATTKEVKKVDDSRFAKIDGGNNFTDVQNINQIGNGTVINELLSLKSTGGTGTQYSPAVSFYGQRNGGTVGGTRQYSSFVVGGGVFHTFQSYDGTTWQNTAYINNGALGLYNSGGFIGSINPTDLTSDRSYKLPDTIGTLALKEDFATGQTIGARALGTTLEDITTAGNITPLGATFGNNMVFNRTTTTETPSSVMVSNLGTGASGIQLRNSSLATNNNWQFFISNDSTPKFKIGQDFVGDFLTILTNGNIGMGTNDPLAELDVFGSIRASTNDQTPTAVVRNGDIPFENYLASGTGASTTITIPHGLTGITSASKVIVQPLNAASAGVTFATIGSVNIVINYTIAPVAGTNNLNYSVLIKK